MSRAGLRVGIDLGGTKIEGAVLDPGGQVLARKRVPTPAGDYEGTVSAVVDLIREVEACAGGQGTVGIGTPGAISPFSGLLRNSNSVALNGRPLDRDLETALGRPVAAGQRRRLFRTGRGGHRSRRRGPSRFRRDPGNRRGRRPGDQPDPPGGPQPDHRRMGSQPPTRRDRRAVLRWPASTGDPPGRN